MLQSIELFISLLTTGARLPITLLSILASLFSKHIFILVRWNKRNSNLLTFLEVTRLELANIPANLSVFLLTLLKNKKPKILVSQNLTSLSSYSRVFFYLAIIRLVVREEVVSFALYLFFATKVYLPTFSEI